MNPRTLKIIAIGYVVKTLLVGVAWLVRPDLPQMVLDRARAAWVQISGDPAR
jgi:hypothetical protein